MAICRILAALRASIGSAFAGIDLEILERLRRPTFASMLPSRCSADSVAAAMCRASTSKKSRSDCAILAAAEAVGAERDHRPADPARDHVRLALQVIDAATTTPWRRAEALRHVRRPAASRSGAAGSSARRDARRGTARCSWSRSRRRRRRRTSRAIACALTTSFRIAPLPISCARASCALPAGAALKR